MRWTVQDEIELCKWVDDAGYSIVYLPQVEEWGFIHRQKPQEINGGFNSLLDLKQHLANLKGVKRDVRIVSESNFYKEVEKARNIRKLH